MSAETITFEIFRYRPEESREPSFQSYEVPYRDDWVILDAINWIKDNVDGTLTYRWSCRMGVCGSCGMNVNGTPELTCNTFLREYRGHVIRVEPLENFPVERDLLIDMDGFMDKLESVKPWLIRRSWNCRLGPRPGAGPCCTATATRRRSTPWGPWNAPSAWSPD